MKKVVLFCCAAMAVAGISMMPANASSFSDVKDKTQDAAISSLESLDIIDGFTDGTFRPDGYLTRGQFAKIATMTLNFNEQEIYSNYTIFPDAEGKMWATSYINAAARKYKILKGFPDGTFRPDEKITYAQAVTIVLSMLGYEAKDIGTLWPSDYMAKARAIGITKGITISPDAHITRGQASVLIYNMLTGDKQDGSAFIESIYKNTKNNAVLLDAGTGSAEYPAINARFYVGETTLSVNSMCRFDSSLIGKNGILVMNDEKTAKGFIRTQDSSVQGKVSGIKADSLYIDGMNYNIPAGTKIYMNDKLSLYSDVWTGLKNTDTISMFFGSNGKVSLLLKINMAKSSQSTVYGVGIFSSTVGKSKIIKNGTEITAGELKKYDIITRDSETGVFYACDRKLKGIYEKATPSYSNPQTITVFGQDFDIPEHTAPYFSNINIGDSIVLLFDDNGTVCAAYKDSEVSCKNTGVFSGLSGETATIDLISGFSVSGSVDLSIKGSGTATGIPIVQLDVGKLVTVNQRKDGQLTIIAVTANSKKYGQWDILGGTLGEYKVSPNVLVYEQVMEGVPLNRVTVDDINKGKIAASDIKNALFDSSGTVTAIVIGDVTGLSWDYGIASIERTDEESMRSTVNLKQSGANFSTDIKSYNPLYYTGFQTSKVIALPKGMNSMPFIRNLIGKTLPAYCTVTASAFDGAQGVTCNGAYIEISDDIQIYFPENKKFISLEEALMNYNKFKIYVDNADKEQPICVLVEVYK